MKKLLSTFRIGMALFLAVFSSNLLPVATAYAAGPVYETPTNGKITICHRTNSVTNPYVMETISVEAADGEAGNSGNDADHYGEHKGLTFDANTYYPTPRSGDQWGDIIPPVAPHSGLNWDAAGQAIYRAGCEVAPVLTVTPTCSNQGAATGSLSIDVTGSANGTQVKVNGTVEATLAENTTLPIVVSSLAAGDYTVTLEKGNTVLATKLATIGVCTVSPTNVTANVTFADPCGTTNDTFTLEQKTGVVYTVNNVVNSTSGAQTGTGTVNVVASAADATYNLTGQSEFSHTFTNEPCAAPCTVSDHTYNAVWTYDGNSYPEAGEGATFQFTSEGLHLSTPGTDDYVYGLVDGGSTKLSDVDAMSYKTFRKAMSAGYAGTAPAYILEIDTNGAAAGGGAYLFYEPYNNGTVTEDTWQTWDALDGGTANWWMSGTGQTLRDWSYFVTNYPDAVVLAYGFNQGTYNAETFSIVQDITFDCATTRFEGAPVQQTEVTPAVPEFLEATCEITQGRLVIPTKAGVVYKVNGTLKSAGTYEYAPGTSVTVTAEALNATYKIVGTSSWNHTFAAAPTNCVLGDTDICPNIPGSQATLPAGYTQVNGQCIAPIGGGGAGQVLGTTLPTSLPATGGVTMPNPLFSLIAGFFTYLFLARKNRKAEA